MSFYTIEQWTVRDVAAAFKSVTGDQAHRKVVIPIFQRGLRWEATRRSEFIDSLYRGYPFGSLLFAKHDSPNTYSVVDGLQRGSTVCNFVYNPLGRDNVKEIEDDTLTKIRLALFPENEVHAINDQIQNIILEYFDDKKIFDEVDLFELAKLILKQIPTLEDPFECVSNIIDAIKPYFNEKKNIYDNICSAVVPIVVYSGPNELLSEIFNRINVKGIPLNNYEIYSAVWKLDKRVINSEDVVQRVVDKYLALCRNGYTIEGFDANTMLINKELTAFEYLFGLGKYWYDKYDCLKVERRSNDDTVNEISFEIVDACISDSKNISNLDKTLYQINVNKLQRRIEEAISFVSDAIAIIGNFKGNKRALTVLHSKYQIVSLVSYVFRAMYDISDLDHKRSTWAGKAEQYKHQLLNHYIADIITNEWHDGGSGKVYAANRDKRYDLELSRQYWETILENHYQAQLANSQAERFSNPTNADCVILNCVYVNIFTAGDQLSSKKFDIEHLATKERMRTLMKPINGLRLPVSCIANLCYLPEDINRGKGEKTIYEAITLSLPIDVIETKFSFTTSEDFSWIYKAYSDANVAEFKESYRAFLDKRFEIIKQKMLNTLGV